MIGTPARRTWNVVVGFFLGGYCAQPIGITGLALYQTVNGTGFSWIRMMWPTVGERLFLMAIPAAVGAALLRNKPYVAVGMFLYSGFTWVLTGAGL